MASKVLQLSSELQSQIEKFKLDLPDFKQISFEKIVESIIKESSIDNEDAHKSKKQKLDDISFDSKSKTTIFQLPNCSVICPMRKKLNFAISFDLQNKYNNIILSNKEDEVQLQIKNTKKSITFAMFLPVIERDNLSYLLIKYDDEKDPLVLSLNKIEVIKHLSTLKKISIEENQTVDEKFQSCTDYIRKQAILTGFKISDPFNINSEINQSFLVSSYIKSKEGTLYFLPEHLLFGIKKPILILPISKIKSINYSTITRLTFSLTLILDDDSKIEFSMIDQQEYDKINNYIVSKHVNDKSLSDELKAKVNAKQEAKGDLSAALKEEGEKETVVVKEEPMVIEKDDEEDSEDSGDDDYEADIDNLDGSEASSDDDDDKEEEEKVKEKKEQFAVEKIQEIIEEQSPINTEVPKEEEEEEEDDEEDSGVDYD